jgi:gamma-glutamyl:cysteine ligase YbdK (ATP-grasp superfamily)
MGSEISKTHFEPEDFQLFQQRLNEQLVQLKQVIRRADFGQDALMLGAELEMYLLDSDWQVACKNQQLLQLLADPQFQTELNQYNLELNLSPVKAAGTPFSALLKQLQEKGQLLRHKADELAINILPIGILPTLQEHHLQRAFMTDIPRYQVLVEQLHKLRGDYFNVNINGDEPVSLRCPDVTAEGANTSFQVHMMVQHERFADTFNAAQLSLPLSIAMAANSPILLGNKVWDETRIALFKQSLDVRKKELFQWQQPARVSFGTDWVRKDSWELFASAVANYAVLVPDCAQQATVSLDKNPLPSLHELNLHMGTIWPWNRPVYCNQGQGHVRIEFRALPAGPSDIDMAANAAFTIGLAVGMAEQIEDYISCIPFTFAAYNFYRAAQKGLDAKILWPSEDLHHSEELPIAEVIAKMLPVARKGLQKLAVEKAEIDTFLGVIDRRLHSGITGARWQKQVLSLLDGQMDRAHACKQLVALYSQHSRSGKEVAQWPIAIQ